MRQCKKMFPKIKFVKEAAKMYFAYYLCVVINFFSTSLYKSAFLSIFVENQIIVFLCFLFFLSVLSLEFVGKPFFLREQDSFEKEGLALAKVLNLNNRNFQIYNDSVHILEIHKESECHLDKIIYYLKLNISSEK